MTSHSELYTELSFPFFDQQIRQRLSDHAVASIESREYRQHAESDWDHIHLCRPPAIPELEALIADCRVKVWPCIYLIPPHVTVPTHRDIRYLEDRSSTIVVPLLPTTGYASTSWYESEADTVPMATATFERMQPTLLNIFQWHGGIVTGPEWRCAFQLSLSATYPEARELILSNQLFGSHACVAA